MVWFSGHVAGKGSSYLNCCFLQDIVNLTDVLLTSIPGELKTELVLLFEGCTDCIRNMQRLSPTTITFGLFSDAFLLEVGYPFINDNIS